VIDEFCSEAVEGEQYREAAGRAEGAARGGGDDGIGRPQGMEEAAEPCGRDREDAPAGACSGGWSLTLAVANVFF
jgi:hypothetical protein